MAITAVFGSSGGCGKTTLATNLAVVLTRTQLRVCLVDLTLAFGDIAAALALTPAAALVTSYQPGLDCVLTPARPGDAERMSPSSVGDLLVSLATAYDHVVVDTPAQLSGRVLAALDLADHHVLVATPERPALKALRLTLDMLDLLSYDRRTRVVVLNRVDSRIALTATEIDSVVRNPIAGRLPFTLDVPSSINRGVPLAAAQPEHPFTRAVCGLAEAHIAADPSQFPH